MILVYGYGITGQAVEEYLISENKEYCIIDGIKDNACSPSEFSDWEKVSLVIVSPGISIHDDLIIKAHKRGVTVKGAFQYAWDMVADRIGLAAVTGTNGKSTVVSMIKGMLEYSGRKVYYAGNIGVPLISLVSVLKKGDIVVAELSSYQLEWIESIECRLGILLNLTEDHLARHKTMKEYRRCKEKLIDFCDNGYILYHPEYFTVEDKNSFAYGEDFSFYGNTFQSSKTKIENIFTSLPGSHNRMNIAFSIMGSLILGAEHSGIKSFLKDFTGLEHRIEFCGNHKNIFFYNDSKSTTFESTYAAVSSFERNILLIISGKLKTGMDLNRSMHKLSGDPRIDKIVILGDLTSQIMGFDGDKIMMYPSYELDELFSFIFEQYENREINVLFSPGLPSFDHFRNFEHRGEYFKESLKGFLNEGQKERD